MARSARLKLACLPFIMSSVWAAEPACPPEAMAAIDALGQQIRHHRQLYYQGKETISDPQFDALVNQLRSLQQCYPMLATPLTEVGAAPQRAFVSLSKPMLSLAATWDGKEATRFVNGIQQRWPGATFLLQPKFDGLAIELHYRAGRLVQAATRGDGQSGQDILPQLLASGAVPMTVSAEHAQLIVRGELYADQAEYQRHFTRHYSSARQLAVATVMSHRPQATQLRTLRFAPWEWVDSPSDSILDGLQQLAKLGFNDVAALSQPVHATSDITPLWQALSTGTVLGASLDGIVLTLDSRRLRDQLGTTQTEPRWALAWKFDALLATTTVEAIRFSQGRTGRLTPVLEIEPVTLNRRQIRRVNGHSLDWLHEQQIGPGAEIAVTLKGAATPQVGQVVRPYPGRWQPDLPTVFAGLCVTQVLGCQERFLLQLEHFRRLLGIRALTPAPMVKLVKGGHVTQLADLLVLDEMTLAEAGFSDREIGGIIDELQQARQQPLATQIRALGLPQLGVGEVRRLAASVDSLQDLLTLERAQWRQMTGASNQPGWLALQEASLRTQISQLDRLFKL